MVFDLINDPIEQWDLIDTRLDCAWVFRPVAMELGDDSHGVQPSFRHIRAGRGAHRVLIAANRRKEPR